MRNVHRVPFTRVKNEPGLIATSTLPPASTNLHDVSSNTEPFHSFLLELCDLVEEAHRRDETAARDVRQTR